MIGSSNKPALHTSDSSETIIGSVMVVGGGIGGIQASMDLAESGFKVYLLEKNMSIGGTMSQLDKTFPTNDCSMCILSPKLVDAGRHRNLELLTNSQGERVDGEPGHFRVTVRKKARYVDLDKCKACGDCIEACPVLLPNEFERGLADRHAIYQLYPQATPSAYGIDKRGTPPCRAQCPLHVSAQGYIALISVGKFEEALSLIRRQNPFPGITGRICTRPCEKACQRKDVDNSIAVNDLKRFVADLEGKSGFSPEIAEENGQRVAVVGSGPAGLMAAYELRRKGYSVVIFEALPVMGGMLAVGIPEYRLPRRILEREVSLVKGMGVEVKLNTPIGPHLTLEQLKAEGYRAIFLATGAHISVKLGIPGEGLAGVVPALEFLKQSALGQEVEVGRRVAVVGGGNAAIDAARTAIRKGAKEVFILYRRSRQEMPAEPEEVEGAEEEGIRIHYLTNPIRIVATNGRISAVQCLRMELGEPDESGRRRPIPVEGSEFEMEADMVIPAIGQAPDLSFVGHCGLAVGRYNTLDVNPATLETNVEGIFAGGDAVTGPKTYIDAMAAGLKAAISIDRYLRGDDLLEGREGEGPQEDYVTVEIEGVEMRERVGVSNLPSARRKRNFREVRLGFTEEQALREAKRCLECGGCSECLECVKVCEPDAILHEMMNETVELEVGSIILCPGFEEFEPSLKGEYGYGRFPNVVSSIEFERILSASGPSMGKVKRPSDQKEPKRIAWIQCVGSRDPHIARGYCSSVCCMYATKEAVIAKEHDPEVEPTIFYMDMRAYGKDFDKYIERARDEYGVKYVRSRIPQVTEDPATHNLRVTYETENGELIRDEFDMVVLSLGLEAPKDAQEIAEVFGIELNGHGFARTGSFEPLKTSRPGIFVGGAFSGPKDVPETVAQASGVAAEASSILSIARGTQVSSREYSPEIDVRYQGPRIGVFICHCGINIGGVVNVPEVVEYAKGVSRVVHVEENLFTCSQDTQDQIKRIIQEHRLNRVVVASCSPRTHEPLFQETIREVGLNPYLLEMANIRDQCSWVHMHEPLKATEKAKDLVRMAVHKAALLEPLPTMTIEVNPRGLVIGGGLVGMEAALTLAEQGYEVYLVEREDELGGNLRYIYHTLEGDTPRERIAELRERIQGHDGIQVFMGSEIEEIGGYVGNFRTRVRSGGEIKELEHGIIIVATGAVEYRPTEYLYGEHEGVITQRELEKRIACDQLALGEGQNIVMIQCVGSRNEEHPYCSRICCSEAIKNALRTKEMSPHTDVYILFRDIRTYGFKEDFYQRAREKGVIFIRYDQGGEPVVESKGGKLEVRVYEPLLGEEIALETDLLVLGTATVPPDENQRLAQMLKVPLNEDGFFLEAHMKLRPVDLATEGIFLAGLAHGPKFIEESISQAKAAVSRACTILSKGHIEVPAQISVVDEQKCVGCGLCEAVCPTHAIEVGEKRTPFGEKRVAQINKALCKGCGICAASCRSGSIDLLGFTDEEIVSQLSRVVA